MRKHYISLILFFCVSIAFAQAKKLSFEYITMEHGLPENRIVALLHDSRGYMWMGTQNGLVRYDGYTNKVYSLQTSSKIKFSYINCLFEDSKGIIWVGTAFTGMFRYDPVADKFTLAAQGLGVDLQKKYIKFIEEDDKGNLWIITRDQNPEAGEGDEFDNDLYYYDTAKKSIQGYGRTHKGKSKIDASVLNKIVKDSKGKIWLGTDNGLYSFNQKKGSFLKTAYNNSFKNSSIVYEPEAEPGLLWIVNKSYAAAGGGVSRFNTLNGKTINYSHQNGLVSDTVYSIYQDAGKHLWAGTFKGLSRIDAATGKIDNYIPSDPEASLPGKVILNITPAPDGNFWLQTLNGLLQFDIKSKKFTRYSRSAGTADGLLSTNVNYEAVPVVDKSGTYYAGTIDMGLLKTNKRKSQYSFITDDPGNEKGFNNGRITDAARIEGNTYLLATFKGLVKWDRELNTFQNAAFLNEEIPVTNMVIGSGGKIWFAPYSGGLWCYDPESGSTKKYLSVPDDAKTLSGNIVGCLLADDKKRIWVGTADGGICRFDDATEGFIRYPYMKMLDNNVVKTDKLDDSNVIIIFQDSKGTIWVGTNYGGLNRLDEKTGKFSHFNDRDIGLMCITSIHETKIGDIWVGSYLNGLFKINPVTGKVKAYREKDGLLANNVHSITEDSSGNLWVASQRGLSILDPKTGRFKHLTKKDGLPETQFIKQGLRDAEGNFLLYTKRGLVVFNPDGIQPNAAPPVTHIQSVSYPDVQKEKTEKQINIFGQKEIELSHNENRVTFNYIGIQFDNPDLNQYAYKLEGYDEEWVEAGTQRSVTYTNLSPGTYNFNVKSANADGVWNEKAATVTITILPPWWRTWWAYILYAVVFAALLRSYIVFRSRKLKQQNLQLEEKVNLRTAELKESLESLKVTQNQLIQSEKMASLGELTAGIAHEIQNPLNFVNNFSEVSMELLDEMGEELDKGDAEEAKAIAGDIKQNLEKINYHGKRADGIVKGMLQHSRASSGQKEPTDINALADEYLRLAYHGLRAKDKSFNAELITNFDESLPKANVIPQDIGRVLLNLFTNAFYATQQKQSQSQFSDYKPAVTVSTSQIGNAVEIIVKDNGTGIPDAIKDKILQPFFTTKPTGEGTGLGLSLSYDIIVKGHGGTIDIDGKEAEGSEFTVKLPVSN